MGCKTLRIRIYLRILKMGQLLAGWERRTTLELGTSIIWSIQCVRELE